MKEKIITEVIQGMLPCLNNGQLIELQRVLTKALENKQFTECETADTQMEDNQKLIDLFVQQKG